MQLKSVNNEIAAFVSGDFKDEVFVVASDEFRDGYLHGLQMQKEWLEAMIANFCEQFAENANKENLYNNSMKEVNTDLVAHGEHIMDDLLECFPNIKDEEVASKLVEFVQSYIAAAVETTLDNPEWFTEEE